MMYIIHGHSQEERGARPNTPPTPPPTPLAIYAHVLKYVCCVCLVCLNLDLVNECKNLMKLGACVEDLVSWYGHDVSLTR